MYTRMKCAVQSECLIDCYMPSVKGLVNHLIVKAGTVTAYVRMYSGCQGWAHACSVVSARADLAVDCIGSLSMQPSNYLPTKYVPTL